MLKGGDLTNYNISILTPAPVKPGCTLCALPEAAVEPRLGPLLQALDGVLGGAGPGLTVFALNMEENVSELMLLKHSGLYLAVIKADKVSGWKNGLNLNATVDGSSEELMSWNTSLALAD